MFTDVLLVGLLDSQPEQTKDSFEFLSAFYVPYHGERDLG